MNKKISCALVTIIIGREFSLNKLLNYFQNLNKPVEFEKLNLYFILGCDNEFTEHLKVKIKEFNLNSKYNSISLIEGNRRCHPNLNWEDWELYTRKKDTLVKHDSALQNINLGLSSIEEEDYIHFVDDDTIPPNHTLDHLYKTYNKVDKCGIASGIYFNKEWLGPTVLTEADELKRRIVASIRKDKWIETCIDDLTVTDHTDIGFVGNGCMLISREDTQKVLPLTEDRDYFDTGAPPDSKICYRLRKLGKKISITPSVVCKHLDDKGEEVGLSTNYLKEIRKSKIPSKILFSNFNPILKYSTLLSSYDTIVILVYTELLKLNNRKKLEDLSKFNNLEIIEKSIKEKTIQYSDENNDDEDMNVLFTLHEIYKYIKDKNNYKVFVYRSKLNDIAPLDVLDSSRLRDFLNTEI